MALSGMTGFSRVEGAAGPWSWSVEARSVNGRNLEARFRGPQGFDALERVVRDGAQSRFARGSIQINLQARRAEAGNSVRINTVLLDQLLHVCSIYGERTDVRPPSLDGLMAVRGVVELAEDSDTPEVRASVEAAMSASVIEALDGLKTSRRSEGEALFPVLTGLVDKIAELAAQAEAEASAQSSAIRDRFERRMAELIADIRPLEERIVQEAALMASRADVREELDRLAAHVTAARQLLSGEGGASGRKLDFLTQEFMRETNTLCSKSATVALTAIGLELKATVEQFREQIQNVE
jgi:uncharacterized protein (TIGR00255 family)